METALEPFGRAQARRAVFAHRADDDKYRRGVVELWTGSVSYPGAARLSAEAAVAAGSGMVRYVGPPAVGAALLAARPEIVLGAGRAQAFVLGSGIADLRGEERAGAAEARLAESVDAGIPAVLDAGALSAVDGGGERPWLLTPHAGELARLAARLWSEPVTAAEVQADAAGWAARIAAVTGTTVLLKGRRTVVVGPQERYLVESPTSALATAGSGDVLAGTIGALAAIAQGRPAAGRPSLASLAAAGAWLHAHAGLLVQARHENPGIRASEVLAAAAGLLGDWQAPLTALSLARALPGVIGALLSERAESS